MDFRGYLKKIEEYALSSDYAGANLMSNMGQKDYQSPNPLIRPDTQNGQVPAIELGLPNVSKRSQIVKINYKHGGITELAMNDNTVVRLTTDQMKLIAGDRPDVGSTLTVVFQRHPQYNGQEDSQIMSIRCENTPKVRMES